MSTDVKSDKTFEEIVERLAALFRLKPRNHERNYEVETYPPDTAPQTADTTKPAAPSRSSRKKS